MRWQIYCQNKSKVDTNSLYQLVALTATLSSCLQQTNWTWSNKYLQGNIQFNTGCKQRKGRNLNNNFDWLHTQVLKSLSKKCKQISIKSWELKAKLLKINIFKSFSLLNFHPQIVGKNDIYVCHCMHSFNV